MREFLRKIQANGLFFQGFVLLVVVLGAPLRPGLTVHQSAMHYAGLVIDFGEGQPPQTYCVSFSEASISGYDLLVRSGVDVEAAFDNTGSAICAIDDVGCAVDNCLTCQMPMYWSYWHWEDGAWIYSNSGSNIYQVTDGAVDGWVWGAGNARPAAIPLAQICDLASATEVLTATEDISMPVSSTFMTLSLPPTATLIPILVSDGLSDPTLTSESLGSPTPEPTQDTRPTEDGHARISYLFFAIVLMGLGVGYIIVQRQSM